MAKEFFIWTGPPAIDRRGNRLKPGQKYRTADFDQAVLKAWAASGAAIYAAGGKGKAESGQSYTESYLEPGPSTARPARKKYNY